MTPPTPPVPDPGAQINPGDLVRYAGDHPGREWRRRAEADCVAYDIYGDPEHLVVSASEPLDGSCPGGVGWSAEVSRVRLVATASWQRVDGEGR